jgi:uncharacterized membrane protein
MKPLIVLLSIFLISLITIRFGYSKTDLHLSLQIAMSAMLLFTAMGHFAFTKGMAAMLPDFIPSKNLIVYLTGIAEITAAITMLIPALSITTAWLLIGFFILILPANIWAAIKHIDYQKGTNDGPGLKYLWFRVPLQLFFILWALAIACCI